MWLAIALLGNLILAVVAIMDKFILTKSVPKPAVFVFYSTVLAMPLLFLVPFGVVFPDNMSDLFIFFASGALFAYGLWALYIGFQESEISHVGPLVGAATPFFVVILSRLFLDEKLLPIKLIAIVILITGSLLVSFEKSKRHNGWHRGMAWGVLAGLFFAFSHVASKYAYDNYGFYSGFVWSKGAIGYSGLFLLLLPSVRDVIFKKKKKTAAKKSNQFSLVAADKILGTIGVILIQYAIAIGSVSLVNALGGVQYAVLIILVALLSKFRPKLFKEQYSPAEIYQEALAVAFIAVGLIVLVLS